MANSDYWRGARRAWLNDADVCSPFRGNASRLAYINRVFEVWHHDANACRNQRNYRALVTLENMGRTAGLSRLNPMIAIKDLEGCFDHLAANRGKWTDNNASFYGGGAFGGFIDDIPWAMATFANAYDANVAEIQKLIEKQKEAALRIKAGIKGTRILWSEVNDPLQKFDQYTKAIDPLMVMCPEAIVKGTRYTWAKNVATLTGAVDDWLKATAASGRTGESAALVALSVIVSKCVPVFGDLYAEALKGIPNAVRFFENIKWERDHTLAQFGKEYMIYR